MTRDRRGFEVADSSVVTGLTLSVDYDDGFVAYLNGVEIGRRNVGADAYNSRASASHEAGTPVVIAVDAGLLVAGANVLALQGHNLSISSSDLSLIPELSATVSVTGSFAVDGVALAVNAIECEPVSMAGYPTTCTTMITHEATSRTWALSDGAPAVGAGASLSTVFHWRSSSGSICALHEPYLVAIEVCSGVACYPAEASISPSDNAVMDVATLTESLLAAGASVDVDGSVSQPFFSLHAAVIAVNGEDIHVFACADAATATGEAQTVSPDGHDVGLSAVTWCSTPHFFGADRLIVLYVGDTPANMELPEALLGPKSVGAWIPPTPCPAF